MQEAAVVRSTLHSAAALARPFLRVLRSPQRLKTLHPSTVRAALHELIETDEATFLNRLHGASRETFERLEADLLGDEAFRTEISDRHSKVRGRPLTLFSPSRSRDGCPRFRLLYYAVRLQSPERCVETGVHDGVSSAVILKALRDNDRGELVSIDLPARHPIPASTNRMEDPALPVGLKPGWVVPDSLRSRWTLRIGCAKKLLPEVLEQHCPIEFFFHDSVHTDAHMTWEYERVWEALAPGGMLVSDDVFWSRAFQRFAGSITGPSVIARGMGFAGRPADPGKHT